MKTLHLTIWLLFALCIHVNAQETNTSGSQHTDCEAKTVISPNITKIDQEFIPDVNVNPVPPTTPTNPTQPRLVFMTHGFQGDNQSWNLQEAWINQNFTTTIPQLVTYTDDQNDMSAAATRMYDLINEGINEWQDINAPKNNNFLLAHSMGGMVFRNTNDFFETDLWPLPLDGFITIGTAHDGVFAAEVLETNPDLYLDLVNYSCESLSIPLLQSAIYNSKDNFASLLSLGISFINEEALCELVTPAIFSQIEGGWSQPIIEDVTPEKAATEWSAPITANNVAFYGVETNVTEVIITEANGSTYAIEVNDTRTPRFFGGIIEKAGDQPIWEADVLDEVGLNLFANGIALLESNQQNLESQEFNLILSGALCLILPPPLRWSCLATVGILSHNNYQRQAANAAGFAWFDNIHHLWMDICGAITVEITETEGDDCQCVKYENGEIIEYTEPNDGDCSIYNQGQPGKEGHVECFPYISVSINEVEEPNDGFILASSAANMPNASIEPQLMQGSSHFQMRNDSQAKNAFERIFQGKNDPFDLFSFFKSE